MRFIIFLLGFLGSLICGFFGWMWLDFVNARLIAEWAEVQGAPDTYVTMVMADYSVAFESTVWAAIFLMVGSALGMLGSLMTLCRRGRHGAVLMVLAAVGPALLSPFTLIFTSVLAFAGMLSVFIRPYYPAADAD